MSDSRPAEGEWYQASDGKFYAGPPPTSSAAEPSPAWYRDKEQRRFERDPTGRHKYRVTELGRWGQWVSEGPNSTPTIDKAGARIAVVQQPPSTFAGYSHKSDAVARFLEGVGWFAVGLSVIAAIVIYTDSQSDYSGSSAGLAFVVGAAGVVQGLILVGFGRIVGYMRTTADQTRRSADLIQKSLDQLG